jgi:hypothetical protein
MPRGLRSQSPLDLLWVDRLGGLLKNIWFIYFIIIVNVWCVCEGRCAYVYVEIRGQTSGVSSTVEIESRHLTQVLGLVWLSHIARQAWGASWMAALFQRIVCYLFTILGFDRKALYMLNKCSETDQNLFWLLLWNKVLLSCPVWLWTHSSPGRPWVQDLHLLCSWDNDTYCLKKS